MFAGYTIGDTNVDNVWKAFDVAKAENSHVEFNYHNDIFCNLAGMKIRNDFDYKSEYLKKLFASDQNLFYSGGSDSHTILKLSERLGLKWESLVLVLSAPTTNGDANLEYLPAIDYAKTHNYNLDIWNLELPHWEKVYSDPNFMYKNGGEINLRADYVHFAPEFDKNKSYLTGQEKPNLIFHEGKWYTWYDNKTYSAYGGLHNVKHFFISPEMPEIYFQECRQLRDHYVGLHGNPPNGKIIGKHQEFQREILFANPKLQNDMVVNKKNLLALQQLWEMGRSDVIYNWLSIVKGHQKRQDYQVTWNQYFGYTPLISWLIEIDSLESVDTSELGKMMA